MPNIRTGLRTARTGRNVASERRGSSRACIVRQQRRREVHRIDASHGAQDAAQAHFVRTVRAELRPSYLGELGSQTAPFARAALDQEAGNLRLPERNRLHGGRRGGEAGVGLVVILARRKACLLDLSQLVGAAHVFGKVGEAEGKLVPIYFPQDLKTL